MSESMFKVPAVVPFVECPNCKQLLEYGIESCPRCREEISSDYALLSAIIVHHNTQACSLANSIKGFDTFVFIAQISKEPTSAIKTNVSKPLIELAKLHA